MTRGLTPLVLAVLAVAQTVWLVACRQSPEPGQTRFQESPESRPSRQAPPPPTDKKRAGTRRKTAPPVPPTLPVNACVQMTTQPLPTHVTISVEEAKVFVHPRVLPTPLTTLKLGVVAPVLKSDGEWFLVPFDDQRWGTRAGYVHCSDVGPLS